MRTVLAPLIALVWLPMSGPSTQAGQSIGCDAVDALASLEADDKLSISITKDPKGKRCVFYVRLPPSASTSMTYQQEAADLALLLSQTGDEATIGKFLPAMQAALFEPIKSGKFDPAAVEVWAGAQADLTKYLSQCAFDTFIGKKQSFVDYSDTFSCGVPDRGYFVVEAKSPSLISALYLPLAQ